MHRLHSEINIQQMFGDVSDFMFSVPVAADMPMLWLATPTPPAYCTDVCGDMFLVFVDGAGILHSTLVVCR